MNPYSISVLLFSFGALVVAYLAIIKRRDIIAIRFLLFSLCAAGWSLFFAEYASHQHSEKECFLFIRAAHHFSVFIPVLWTHFTLDFIRKGEPFERFYFLSYIFSFTLFIFSFTPLFIKGAHSILGFDFYPSPGPAYHFFTFMFFVLVSYSFYHLIKAFTCSQSGRTREQLKYFTAATFLAFVGGSSTFFPVYKIPVPIYLLFLMPLYPFLMGMALMRYGLFDSEQIADAFQRDKLAAIGTLAASINHEIRNPLYIIQGNAESYLANLQEGIYKDQDQIIAKATEILKKTAEQSTRAIDIMKRFAVFAKQRVDQKTAITEVSLSEVLENVLLLVNHELELDKIELIKHLPQDLPSLHADRRHLEEILFNLIVNACQAMKRQAQKGRITLTAESKNHTLKLKVEDNGPGIPEAHLSHIFEPFYTTKDEGTGLGLYVTKQLVERNGGRISVKSKLEQGTTFMLEFPKVGVS